MSLPKILAQIRAFEAQAGRRQGSVRLVAVTKGQSLDRIRTCVLPYINLQLDGIPLAEGRAQELRDKATCLPEVQWHFVGPLQLNKVKYMRPVTLIHSLSDLRQAKALAEVAIRWGRAPDVLLQLHNGESQKYGIHPDELRSVYSEVVQIGLTVRGLMVMAPHADDTAALRVFKSAAMRGHDLGLAELSMGMSDDFPLAIRSGATLVRIGRSLFYEHHNRN